MIVVLAKDISPHDVGMVKLYLKDRGFTVQDQAFGDTALLGASGPERRTADGVFRRTRQPGCANRGR